MWTLNVHVAHSNRNAKLNEEKFLFQFSQFPHVAAAFLFHSFVFFFFSFHLFLAFSIYILYFVGKSCIVYDYELWPHKHILVIWWMVVSLHFCTNVFEIDERTYDEWHIKFGWIYLMHRVLAGNLHVCIAQK